MEIRIGKWEKENKRRIYFNCNALGGTKVYLYEGKDGGICDGVSTYGGPKSQFSSDVFNQGTEIIEAMIGKKIDYRTKFSDVWGAIK